MVTIGLVGFLGFFACEYKKKHIKYLKSRVKKLFFYARLRSQSTGKYAKRDIVQFVQLSNFHSIERRFNKDRDFNKEVLHEIPGQVVDYFLSKGVLP